MAFHETDLSFIAHNVSVVEFLSKTGYVRDSTLSQKYGPLFLSGMLDMYT